MERQRLDVAVFSSPESVFYFTGLDHWGYFAPHHLIVPLDGEPVLLTRLMEQVTIENQVKNARFVGHRDGQAAASLLVDLLNQYLHKAGAAPARGRSGIKLHIGLEEQSAGLPALTAGAIRSSVLWSKFFDITGLSDQLRLVKSPAEMQFIRQAAHVSDAGMQAALNAIGDGAREADVAADASAAMIRAGGHPPGFGPFIRPSDRLGEEHTTWGDGVYRTGEQVFLELSGCISRYHAPMGRLAHIGAVRDEDARMAETAQDAFDAVVEAIKPGALACEVYAQWQEVVDAAGLAHYRRHHCGYCVGIGFPPSWTGGTAVTGLRHDSDLEVREGMSFHILSWLMGTGRGSFFLSNTVLLGPDGAEVLTTTPAGP